MNEVQRVRVAMALFLLLQILLLPALASGSVVPSEGDVHLGSHVCGALGPPGMVHSN